MTLWSIFTVLECSAGPNYNIIHTRPAFFDFSIHNLPPLEGMFFIFGITALIHSIRNVNVGAYLIYLGLAAVFFITYWGYGFFSHWMKPNNLFDNNAHIGNNNTMMQEASLYAIIGIFLILVVMLLATFDIIHKNRRFFSTMLLIYMGLVGVMWSIIQYAHYYC